MAKVNGIWVGRHHKCKNCGEQLRKHEYDQGNDIYICPDDEGHFVPMMKKKARDFKMYKEVIVRAQPWKAMWDHAMILDDSDDGERARAFLLGGQKNIVEVAIPLRTFGGCKDAPDVTARHMAETQMILIKHGITQLGVGFSRLYSMYDNPGDCGENMWGWLNIFPNMVSLVIDCNGNVEAFHLAEDDDPDAEIMDYEVRNKVVGLSRVRKALKDVYKELEGYQP